MKFKVFKLRPKKCKRTRSIKTKSTFVKRIKPNEPINLYTQKATSIPTLQSNKQHNLTYQTKPKHITKLLNQNHHHHVIHKKHKQTVKHITLIKHFLAVHRFSSHIYIPFLTNTISKHIYYRHRERHIDTQHGRLGTCGYSSGAVRAVESRFAVPNTWQVESC